jgi:hypothetical protein
VLAREQDTIPRRGDPNFPFPKPPKQLQFGIIPGETDSVKFGFGESFVPFKRPHNKRSRNKGGQSVDPEDHPLPSRRSGAASNDDKRSKSEQIVNVSFRAQDSEEKPDKVIISAVLQPGFRF